MKTNKIIKFLLAIFIIALPICLLAQPPGFDQDTNDVPIDGGLSLLLAAGIGYGIKRKFKQAHDDQKNKPATKD
jgi:hypothetical protein